MLAENRPDADRPKYIFVLRDGLSEGQFAMAVDEKLKAIKRGCAEFDPEYHPKFVFVIESCAWLCDRRQFVREDCPEFFMQSHYPLKGVGKPVEYSVLVDEIGVSQDELQGLLNSLCYSHQIVNSAISLPEPIYQADELAKRGQNNYLAMKRLEGNRIPQGLVGTFAPLLGYDDRQFFSAGLAGPLHGSLRHGSGIISRAKQEEIAQQRQREREEVLQKQRKIGAAGPSN
uniref:Piwi domain-containing protein n=1 Tax=Ditylenchus dipsaci TaxID=166011 RepID=A0A915E8P9_9BILA